MTRQHHNGQQGRHTSFNGHRLLFLAVLCLFGLGAVQSRQAAKKRRQPTNERVFLVHADRLRYDQWGNNPMAQVLNGNVQFMHKGARLFCDSAYFYQESNSFKAFGHVRMLQGDTLSLTSDYAWYDGNEQMAEARHNVVLTHRATKLYTDSLNYDRLYGISYFFEGGKMIDRDNVLVSDWGQYNTETRLAVFYYNVDLKNPKFLLNTDTLHYDTRTSEAHIVGPSQVVSGKSIIHTSQGFYNTRSDLARLYGRSTLVNQGRTMTGDSLYHNDKTGISQGFGNVEYVDSANSNALTADYCWYNEETGFAFATGRAVMKEFSQRDTLYLHSDTMKVYTHNINTDSVYRKAHCYNHVRAYRTDVQAVCDSLVYNTRDSVMTMYKDPITWSGGRQLLGEVIEAYMKDSVIDRVHVINQALSVEQLPDSIHFNQLSAREMFGFFDQGEIRSTEAVGNVIAAYFMQDDKDSSLISMAYIETDTMRMTMRDRQLQRIWACKHTGTMYPVTQLPPAKAKLPSFAWFDDIRPRDKDDIFEWRGKKKGTELKTVRRHAAPLQHLGQATATETTPTEAAPAHSDATPAAPTDATTASSTEAAPAASAPQE